MGNPRPGLTEQDLRETKADLTDRLANQQRIGGVKPTKSSEDHPAFHANAIPDVKAIEDYINPILRKVEVKHEEDRSRDLVRKEEEDPEEMGEEVLTKRENPELEKQGIRDYDIQQHMGTYQWNLRTDAVAASPGSWTPPPPKRESVRTIAARHRIRFLKQLPEWRKKFEQIFMGVMAPAEKEAKFLELLDSSNRLFGDWRKPREPKVSIFGKKG